VLPEQIRPYRPGWVGQLFPWGTSTVEVAGQQARYLSLPLWS
jgi:hypothetical protein